MNWRRGGWSGVLCASALLVVPAVAGADEEGQHRWYGWEILLADPAVFVLSAEISAAADTDDYDAQVAIILPPFLLTGPAIHLANRQPRQALKSFGLRAGLTVVPMGLMNALRPCRRTLVYSTSDDRAECRFAYAAVSYVIGAPIAMVVDAAVLARKPVGGRTRATAAMAPLELPRAPAKLQLGLDTQSSEGWVPGLSLSGQF